MTENKTATQNKPGLVMKNTWFQIDQNQDQNDLPMMRRALHHSVSRMALVNDANQVKPGQTLLEKWQHQFKNGQWLNDIQVVMPNAIGSEWLAKKLLLALPNNEKLEALVTIDDHKPADGMRAHLFVMHAKPWTDKKLIDQLKLRVLER